MRGCGAGLLSAGPAARAGAAHPLPASPRRCFGTKCAGCAQGISPSDLVRRARSKVFHLNCFTCMMCNKQLSTGEELYIIDENKFVCKEDYLNNSNTAKENSLHSGEDVRLGGCGARMRSAPGSPQGEGRSSPLSPFSLLRFPLSLFSSPPLPRSYRSLPPTIGISPRPPEG